MADIVSDDDGGGTVMLSQYTIDNGKQDFFKSREAELKGLKGRKVFRIVKRDIVPNGTRVYGTRWVDIVKNVNGEPMKKSELIYQNFKDKGASHIAKRSPTITRMG